MKINYKSLNKIIFHTNNMSGLNNNLLISQKQAVTGLNLATASLKTTVSKNLGPDLQKIKD